MTGSYHIRRATEDDAADMLTFMADLLAERNPFLPLTPEEFTFTLDQEKELITKFNKTQNSAFFVARDAANIIAILNCNGGNRIATRHAATLGISVAQRWRNQGVGTALLTHLLDWARGGGVLKRLELFVYQDNAVAIHMYKKHGFLHEGARRKAFLRDGEYVDDLIMALLL